MSMFVCLSVCPHAHVMNHTSEHHQIYVRVVCGRDSVSRYVTYTSGFMDGVMSSHYGPSVGVLRLQQRRERANSPAA